MIDTRKLGNEAQSIADRYNWEPEFSNDFVTTQLQAGIVPDGFGRLVGQTIALFLRSTPLWFITKPCPSDEDRAHAKQLARLRFLCAKISNHNRRRDTK